jgi:hypothetical protein
VPHTCVYVRVRLRVVVVAMAVAAARCSDERNYHIFYQLIAGATPTEAAELHLSPAESFRYLNMGGVSSVAGVDDAMEFATGVTVLPRPPPPRACVGALWARCCPTTVLPCASCPCCGVCRGPARLSPPP